MKKAFLLLAATGLLQAAEEKTVTIDYLKNHPHLVSKVVDLWYSGQKNLPVKPTEDMTEKLHEHCNDDKLPMCLIALDGDEAVGMIRLIENWSPKSLPEIAEWTAAHPEASPWLCGLIVKASHRRRGIAHKLIAKLEQKALGLGKSTLYLSADDEIKGMYSTYGYEDVATIPSEDGCETIMKRLIAQPNN